MIVGIKVFEGQSREKKKEVSKKITEAINDVMGVPKEVIWVVWQDINPGEWAVGGKMCDEK